MSGDIAISDLLNKPYELGARGPDSYDCWGLVMTVYKRMGIDLPDINNLIMTKRDIIRVMRGHAPVTGFTLYKSEPKNFDILYDDRKGHVGIIIGTKVLHAAEGYGVVFMPYDLFMLTNPYARYYEHSGNT